MIKSIFISPLQLDRIEESGANHLVIVDDGLNKDIWERLKALNLNLSISVNTFGPDGCPANPRSKEKLFDKLKKSLEFRPKEIWIDHFRFDGHWEKVEGDKIPKIHLSCKFCSGKPRVEVLRKIAQEAMGLVEKRTKVGYFAVPLKDADVPELIIGLGQDHSIIGKI